MLQYAPAEVSVEAYLDALTPEELREAVLRCAKKMDGAHRTQLALFLGHDMGGDPIDDVGGSAVGERELRSYVESCTLLRERFGAFLHENPRAIAALGIKTNVSEEPASQRRRLSPRMLAMVAGAVTLAVIPLFAQYAHQRDVLAGLDQAFVPAQTASIPAKAVAAAPRHSAVKHHRIAHTVPKKKPVRRHRAVVAVHPAHKAHTVAVRRTPHARRRVASVWKFAPQYNPYLNHRRWRAIAHVHGTAPADRFASRAKLLVTSYLAAAAAGNTPVALQHLGLPAHADAANVREAPILGRNTRVRVVGVRPQSDGTAKVEVDINSRAGEYFEVFYVGHDGPAARIGDRYYIPVDRTAEERSARLLAKDGH